MTDNLIDVSQINSICKGTLMEHLQIEYFKDSENNLYAKMPITKMHLQPMGILHGGASLALAESLGSAWSFLKVDISKFNVVGHNIQATHIKSSRNGILTATCIPIHVGKKTHVLDITIKDDQGRTISVCRVTNIILKIAEK